MRSMTVFVAGPLAPVHYEQLVGVFLHLLGTGESSDELLRASALSALADLVIAAGPHKMAGIRHEVIITLLKVHVTL